jgi:hypothetical protein
MRHWPSRGQEKREGDAIPALSVAVADWGGVRLTARCFPPPWTIDETEAPRLAVSLGPNRSLGEGQEPGGTRGRARGREGVGPIILVCRSCCAGKDEQLADRPAPEITLRSFSRSPRPPLALPLRSATTPRGGALLRLTADADVL